MDIASLLAANELTATNLETGEAMTNPELVEGHHYQELAAGGDPL